MDQPIKEEEPENSCEDATIAPRPPVDGHFLRFLYKCFQIHSATTSSAEVGHSDWEELKELGIGLSLDDCFSQLRLLSSEGLLDGVVPYAARQSLLENSAQAKEEMRAKVSRVGEGAEVSVKRRPQSAVLSAASKFDISLNVVDDAKSTTKEYKIPSTTLLEHMGYFASLASNQKLEDVDITVHCDIAVFDWLISWIKQNMKKDEEPLELTSKLVVPVLISAEFLQMGKLVDYGLLFLKNNLQEVIPHTPSFSILGDQLLERLAKLVHQSELEALDDPKDRLKTKLFCKLIVLLVAPMGDHSAAMGHFSSAASLFRCADCGKFLTQQVVHQVECVPGKFTFTRTGSVLYQHQRDPRWNINDYLKALRTSKGLSWRRIYWHLWGVVHFFRCTRCGSTFPAQEMGCCWFHPELPEYHWVEANASKQPVGRFPCCDMKAWRFDPLPSSVSSQTSGCHRTDHSVQLVYPDKATQDSVLMMYDELMSNRDLVCWGAPSPTSPSTRKATTGSSFLGRRSAAEEDACRNSTHWLENVVNMRPFGDQKPLVNLVRIGVPVSDSCVDDAEDAGGVRKRSSGSFDGVSADEGGFRLESHASLRQSSTEDDEDSDLAEDEEEEEEEGDDDGEESEDGDGESEEEVANNLKPVASPSTTTTTPSKQTTPTTTTSTQPAPSSTFTAATTASSAKQNNRTSHLRRNRRIFNKTMAAAAENAANKNPIKSRIAPTIGTAARRLRPATAAAVFASAALRNNRTSVTIQQRAKNQPGAGGFQAFIQNAAPRAMEKPKRWSYLFSTRHNQDNQRDYETKIMSLLVRHYSSHQEIHSAAKNQRSAQMAVMNRDYTRGGSFVKLEKAWAARHGTSSGSTASGGASGYSGGGGGGDSGKGGGGGRGGGLFKSRVRSAMGVLVERP